MAARFLRSLFRGTERWFCGPLPKTGQHSTFCQLSRERWYNDAAQSAMLAREKSNVYFAIGVQGQQPHKGRGTQAGVIALPGLWGDLDVLGPNHVATNLPPSLEDAWKVIRGIPFKPTVVVYTGGGYSLIGCFANRSRRFRTRIGLRRSDCRRAFNGS